MSDTQFFVQPAETRVGRIALVTIDNGEDYTKPSTFGRAAFESLQRALERLEREEWAGLVLTGKPFVFAAGADIREFPKTTTAELARAGGRAGHDSFARLAALSYPTLAAINGAALGGGVEIALHCDLRTISAGVRHFACPECFLGIIPGWGGTQLVPRLVGPATAVKFIVTNAMRQNKMLTGPEAFELGFADALLEPVEFLDESLAFLIAHIEAGAPAREPADLSDTAEVIRKARLQLEDSLHGAAPAPIRALDLIEGASTWTIEEGYRAEEDALADLLPGPQAQASVYAFDLVERRAKKGVGIPDAEPRRIEKVGIVGAGLMARQLAALFVKRLEVPVVLRDLEQEIVDEAVAEVRSQQRKPFLAELVSGSTDYEIFAGCDLILEAVFEELSVKHEVIAELRRVAPDAIVATNTSSLSVTEMGADVGLHFFNPVAVLPLVEIVATPSTDDVVLATAWDVVKRLRKRGVLVQDAPAFVVNRVLTRMTTVLMDALEHGNTVEETDAAILRLGNADGSVRAAADGGAARREPRAAHAARRLSRSLPALADAGQLRRRLGGDRRARGRAPQHRGADGGGTRGGRGRDPPSARRGRRRRGRRRRHVPDPRCRLPVLPRRDHEAPRPAGHSTAPLRRPVRQSRGAAARVDPRFPGNPICSGKRRFLTWQSEKRAIP